MFEYTKEDLNELAHSLNFVRDTLEKVLRLVKILDFINSNPITKNKLALKGGTAINLTIFKLPRLSVDIDLDYTENNSREEMLQNREQITEILKKYLQSEQYSISPNSKNYHSLSSIVAAYTNSAGMKDNIKIEINYSLRAHIFTPENKKIILENIQSKNEILVLNKTEIFASKLNALLGRGAVRDLYDINNMIQNKIFSPADFELLKKSFIFYTALSQEKIPSEYTFEKIDAINTRKIFAELLPVIHNGTFVHIEEMKNSAKQFYSKNLMPTQNESDFLELFSQKQYNPALIFSDTQILKNIENHPMVAWKMLNHDK